MGISENIKRLRTEKGWTQEELAKMVGVSRATVTQWETGWSQPRMGAVQKLAGAFNVPIANVVDSTTQHDSDSFMLTKDERELIEAYRKLDYNSRDAVKQLVAALSPKTESSAGEEIA